MIFGRYVCCVFVGYCFFSVVVYWCVNVALAVSCVCFTVVILLVFTRI